MKKLKFSSTKFFLIYEIYGPPVKDCSVLVNFTGSHIYVAYISKTLHFSLQDLEQKKAFRVSQV